MGELSEERKLRAVGMCFYDDALMWYRWERDRNPFVSWEQMKYRVLELFSTTHDITARERLMTLRQGGTVREFIKDIITLASNAPEVSDTMLETAFMIGLKPQIKAGVKLMEPRNLRKMMSVAKLVEEWVSYADPSAETFPSRGSKGGGSGGSSTVVLRGGSNGGNGPGYTNNSRPNNGKEAENPNSFGKKQTMTGPNNNGKGRAPFRRLSPAEFARYRAEGLCFQCGGKSHSR